MTEPINPPPRPRLPVPFVGLTVLAVLLFAVIILILLIRQPWNAVRSAMPTAALTPTAALSPSDTRQIAFMSNRDGNWEIYQLTLGSGEWVNLTNHPAADAFPSYSTDGGAITFVSSRDRAETNDLTAYNMDADGSNQRRVVADLATIIDIVGTGRFDWDEQANPAGTLFVSLRDLNLEIYVTPPGGETANISRSGAIDWFPSISAVREAVVFGSDRDGGDQNIYIAELNGEGLRPLTSDDTTNLSPAWSSDGSVIVFYSDREAALDSGAAVLYTLDPYAESPSPLRLDSGTSLIFDQQFGSGMADSIYMAHDGNDWEIYYSAADGESAPVNLTNNEADELFPTWRQR